MDLDERTARTVLEEKRDGGCCGGKRPEDCLPSPMGPDPEDAVGVGVSGLDKGIEVVRGKRVCGKGGSVGRIKGGLHGRVPTFMRRFSNSDKAIPTTWSMS